MGLANMLSFGLAKALASTLAVMFFAKASAFGHDRVVANLTRPSSCLSGRRGSSIQSQRSDTGSGSSTFGLVIFDISHPEPRRDDGSEWVPPVVRRWVAEAGGSKTSI